MVLSLLLGVFSVKGLFVSFYFLSAKMGWFQGFVKNMPLCDGDTCIRVSDSRYGSMFGIPNYIFGIFYYIMVIVLSFITLNGSILYLALAVSYGTVLYGVYLTYALLVKLKIVCVPCFISHGINLGIAVLFTIMAL